MDMRKLVFILNRKAIRNIYKKSRRGVTPIIATILILAMVIAGVVIGFTQIVPYIERSKVETDASTIQSTLIKIDNIVWDMISDSAGSYIPDSVPSRKLLITVPIGSLEPITTQNSVTYFTSCSSCTNPGQYSASNTTTLGAFSHTFSSNYVLLPDNTLLYLTGSDPYQRRNTISYNSISSSLVEDQSATNISLYRIGYDHYVDLSYRPKIIVSQSIQNNQLNYNINLFLVKLTGSTQFIGTTNLFVKFLGTTVDQRSMTGGSSSQFSLNIGVDGVDASSLVPSLSGAPGGFITNYNFNIITYTFSFTS